MEELRTIELEIQAWSTLLNIAVGAPSLAFALACVALPAYINLVAGAVSVAMWFSLMAYAKPSFSKKLLELRSRDDDRAKEIISFAEENFLSNRKFSPYLIGSLSLIGTVAYLYGAAFLKIILYATA
jgi:hypothetical protein